MRRKSFDAFGMSSIADVLILAPLDMRTAARKLYPGSRGMQRKWLRAVRAAPGARCSIGTKCDPQEYLHREREKARAYLAVQRLRPALVPVVAAEEPPPPRADRVRRVI